MLSIKDIVLFDGKEELQVNDDVAVEISQNYEISIKSRSTPLSYIKIGFDVSISENTLILGDSWERAYGDLAWEKPNETKKMPWYFTAKDGNDIFCIGVKTNPNAFCYWQWAKEQVFLVIDVRNGTNPIMLNGRTLVACTVVHNYYTGDVHDAIHSFCKMMCENPRIPDRQIYGGNDWYCNYGDNSFDKILTHAKRIVECSPKNAERPFMVIDDGWQLCHHDHNEPENYFNGGPWRYCNQNFGSMKKMAEEIEKAGAIPGLWFRPLLTIEKVNDECILSRSAQKITLDPSVPKVLEMIKQDVRTIVSWGYKLIKHDFTTFDIFGQYGFGMTEDMFKEETSFYDKTKTTAEIVKTLYETIRGAAGEDVLLMGCNTFSHLSAGVFDLQRTGDDTSGLDWERTKKYGINTLAFRMCQHNAFYFADADCVGITKEIPWELNKQWLDVLAKSGTALFVSIAEDSYTEEIKKDITQAFAISVTNTTQSYPLDWEETITPEKWKSKFGTNCYKW